MTAMLASPERDHYEPFVPSREQAEFILRFYELDPETCQRVVSRSVISRSRGWGKSPIGGGLSCVEALADVVPDGWDAYGQPVGMPWSRIRTPLVHIAGVAEAQTSNTWRPLLEMLNGPVLDAYPGLEPLDTFVNLPRRGRIETITSSPNTVKGGLPHFAVLDQTETWVRSNGGLKLASVLINNATKRGGSVLETPNAFIPGDGSVAENTALAAAQIREGRSKLTRGFLYDHREAPPETDIEDERSLVAGLRVAYGDSSDHPDGCVLHDPPCAPGWAPIETIKNRIWQPDADPEESQRDFLNQVTHASNAWLSGPEWRAVRANFTDQTRPVVKALADRDIITLGFDGSRGRTRGKPDATALVGCRVADGHLFQVRVWEADDDKRTWAKWSPSIVEIEAELADLFKRYRVAAFYADPGKDWRSYVNAWEATYGSRVKVKATRDHPFEWWMTGGRSGLVQRAVEQLEGAVLNHDLTHDGAARMTAHVLNARRRISAGKLALAKESDYSPNKIDAAVAAVLAWQARLDAVAAGPLTPEREFSLPERLY